MPTITNIIQLKKLINKISALTTKVKEQNEQSKKTQNEITNILLKSDQLLDKIKIINNQINIE